MLRSDTSPVKDRLSTFALQNPKAVFSACGNTLNNQSKQESKEITLVSEARIVRCRVMELQEQGWAYVASLGGADAPACEEPGQHSADGPLEHMEASAVCGHPNP